MGDLAARVLGETPLAATPDDQPFRLTTSVFQADTDAEVRTWVLDALREGGADTTENNLWLLGWLGGFNKLAMARRALAELSERNIEQDADQVVYVGDSLNDAPIFGFFRRTVGVSTIRTYLPEIQVPPAWVTDGLGGAGFVEVAEAILAA